MLTYGIIGEQENLAMGEEFSSQCSLVVKPETQRYLHNGWIQTQSSMQMISSIQSIYQTEINGLYYMLRVAIS